jgi:hypothetical protein
MTPTLEATQTGEDTYKVDVRPDHGIPVTLYVVPWPGSNHWYVKRSPDPTSMGYITKHTSFEAAAKAATGRAKRYLASYARTHKRRAVAA